MSDSVPTARLGEAGGRPLPNSEVLARGATVGRYVIVSLLGEGGMGVVYAAYDSQLDRKVALKLLRPGLPHDGDTQEIESRLLREAQAMARLSHPNVVAVHDVGLDDHRIFLAMEYVEGETLKKWLKTERPLRERIRVLRDAGRGLAAAHAVGLVHRDFKPDNVMVAKDGRVVVLDFGVARSADAPVSAGVRPLDVAQQAARESGSLPGVPTSPLTLTGSILGTVGFMAPEQGLGEATTPATDQFSYAVTLYVALYGRKPFPGRTLEEYLDEVHRPVPEPKDAKRVPPWMRRVVLRGLAPEPSLRFASMEEMIEALEKDPLAVYRRGARVLVALGALAAVAFAMGREIHQRELACSIDASELRGAWDDGVRARVGDAFEATGADGARERASRVSHKLDEFATAWLSIRSQTCRDTRVRKTESEEVFRLRSDCLDRALTEVKSLTGMLATADLQVVKKSTEIAYGLPQLAFCLDAATLRASTGLPDAPLKRERVKEVRAKLAESESNWLAGKAKVAEERAAVALTMAREIGHAPTLAEALFIAGRSSQRQGDYAVAAPLLREAVLEATKASVDRIVVQAAGELSFVEGPELQHAGEARIWLDLARSALERIGGNEELELDVLRSETGLAEEVDERPDLAAEIGEKIVAKSRRLYGVHPKTALAVYNLGNSYATLGDPARARPLLEDAVAMSEAVAGPTYPLLGWSEQMLGQTLAELGETERAESLLVKAIIILDENRLDNDSALAFERLAGIALTKGDFERAAQHAERAVARLDPANAPGFIIPIVNVTAAFARLRVGAPGALALCEAALAHQEEAKEIDPSRIYQWDGLRCKAEALMASGESREAMALLERSLKLPKRTFRGDYARAEFALARALLLSHLDRARALSLATAAKAEFEQSPFLGYEAREVEAWLAQPEKRKARAGRRPR